MEERTYTRIVAVVALVGIWGAALAITLPEQTKEFEAPFDLHTRTEQKSLRDELLLCSQLNTTSGDEERHCEEIWAENRHRFFSRSPQHVPSSDSIATEDANAPHGKTTWRILPVEEGSQQSATGNSLQPFGPIAPKHSARR